MLEDATTMGGAGAELEAARPGHQLDLEASTQVLMRRGRRLAHQTLEAQLVLLALETSDAVVEDDRESASVLGLALHEDQSARAGTALPVDAARVVATPKLAQRVELGAPAAAIGTVFAMPGRPLLHLATLGEELGIDQQLTLQPVAQPLAEEAQGKDAPQVSALEHVQPAPGQHQVETCTGDATRRQEGHEALFGAVRDRTDDQPPREEPGPAGELQMNPERPRGVNLVRYLEAELESSQVGPRDQARDDQQGQHRGQHKVERVVARIGRRDRDDQHEDDVPEADPGDADAFRLRSPSHHDSGRIRAGRRAPSPRVRSPGDRPRGHPPAAARPDGRERQRRPSGRRPGWRSSFHCTVPSPGWP